MAITLVHDCDVERRDDPTALNGDFRDCHIDESLPHSMHDGTQVSVGVIVPGGKGTDYERRGLFLFDLNAYIPASATITAAVWWFYVQSTDAAAIHLFGAVRCRRTDFEEDVATWNGYKSPLDGGYASGGGVNWLDQAGAGWTPNQWIGYEIKILTGTGAGQVRTVLSNTATRIYVTVAWGTPPNNTSTFVVGNPWTSPGASDTTEDRDTNVFDSIGALDTTGWKNINFWNLVNDAWSNRSGICAFIMERSDIFMGAQGTAYIHAKNYQPYGPETHHLRITYTLAGRTFQVMVR